MDSFAISARQFAQPLSRQGSIDQYSGYGQDLQTGQEVHQILQTRLKRELSNYQSEHSLESTFQCDDIAITIRGRIDGVIREPGETILEEIKSTTSLTRLKASLKSSDFHPYKLQVATYAFLWQALYGEWPTIRLRLASSLTIKDEIFEWHPDPELLRKWFADRQAQAIEEWRQLQAQVLNRRELAGEMVFPFKDPRPQQHDLINYVGDGLSAKQRLLVQAPTGLGKTAAVTLPSLKRALGRGSALVYITPKNSQHGLILDFAKRLQEKASHPLRTVTIQAKKKSCRQEEPLCTPEHCEYAKDYYTKMSAKKVLEQMRQIENLGPNDFQELSDEHEVCPFEISLEAALEAEIVIADYNYVFSPRAAFTRLFIDDQGASKKVALVIDEAHNLVDRSLGYFSPEIDAERLASFLDQSREVPQRLRQRWRTLVKDCQTTLFDHRPQKLSKGEVVKLDAEAWITLLARCNRLAVEYFNSIDGLKDNDPIVTFQKYLGEFCFTLDYFDDKFYAVYLQDERLKIICCDASFHLKPILKQFEDVVAFSATLKPFEYFRQMAGFDDCRLDTKEFVSPFPEENRKILVIPQVSTKFKDRQRNFAKIGEGIARIASARPGNYLAFFPSFAFLNACEPFIAKGWPYEILVQQRRSSRAEQQKILAALEDKNQHHILLGVQGGVFAEGIDYHGNLAIGAFIVGPGLPVFDIEREILRDYYEDRYQQGFQYAYLNPAMTRVVQSAGRVIRSEEDRGIIVLFDQRFLVDDYASRMPGDWYGESPRELVSQSILADLGQFWDAPVSD